MRLQPSQPPLLDRCLIAPLALLGLAASCADPVPTSPRPTLQLDVAAHEVIIRDEEWADRTALETPVEMAGASALAAEPVIRVGVLYAELNVTTVRIAGRDADDTYELRSGSASGPVLATGLSGDIVATIVGSGSAAQIDLALPGGGTLPSPDPVVLRSASGFVRIRRVTTDASVYRGTAEVRFNASRTRLVGVNELPIEQYLYGVVPRELPPNPYGQPEAQKAQAVAARTFARRRMQFCGASRCGHGYHVVPTTSDQVYGGFTAERAVSSAAVDGTRGLVATYGGALIETLYSSTSGGWTANSGDVFLSQLPYLVGVPDHERGEALRRVPSLEVFKRHANPTNLRNHANGDFEADWSIYHRWYVDWTPEEMRQVVGRVQSATFIDPGAVYAINVVRRSSSARAYEVEFVTERRGTLRATKDAIRSALRYVTYTSGGAMVLNSLRSTLVYLEPIIDPKTDTIVGWQAWGGGWGHGTGMSQTGAAGMAERGRTFEEILGHYYQGVALERRWE
ncbi:MAG TPA: SpoIID/LytB domain-containing protein [Gemmatimonadales bacterium]|nr:SpoIID/LytB domain-containing protein [Gemmatimonadales bacterium]